MSNTPSSIWLDETEQRSNLTRSQYLIWTGQQVDPLLPLYNIAHATHLHGILDVDRFCTAFDQLLSDSQALRTVIRNEDGVPQQALMEPSKATMEWVDFSQSDNPEGEASAWLRRANRQPMKLDQATFQAALLKLSDDHHIWYLLQHHVVTDAWSFQVLSERMAALYANEEQAPLSSFSDYIERERSQRQMPGMDRIREFWAGELVQDVQQIDFYGAGSKSRGVQARRYRQSLGEERTRALKTLAAQPQWRMLNDELSQLRVFSALLSGFLARLSGFGPIVLGCPVHNRANPVDKATDGLFIELFPLQISVNEQDRFNQLGEATASSLMGWLSHARAGLSSPQSNRSYDVVLNFLHAKMPAFDGLETRTDWLHSGFGDREHALRVQVHDFDQTGNWNIDFDCNTGVFDSVAAQCLQQQFLLWVDGVLANPEAALTDIKLTTQAFEQQTLVEFNAPMGQGAEGMPALDGASVPGVLGSILAQATRQPDKLAIRNGDRSLTYLEMLSASQAMADRLTLAGVEHGDLVALLMPRSIDAVVAMLACWQIRAAYVPLDPNHPSARLENIFHSINASAHRLAAVVCSQDGSWPEQMSEIPVVSPVLDTSIRSLKSPTTAPSDLAYVIFTSGSTGDPKGVELTQGAVANYLCWAAEQYAAGEPPTVALHSALTVDLTVTSVYVPLMVGGDIVVYPDMGQADLPVLRVFADDEVDLLKLTPAHLSLIREAGGRNSRIRTLIVGGEAFNADLARAIQSRFHPDVKIYNEYGPTEATVGCMVHQFDPMKDTSDWVPIGRPIHAMEIFVLDGQSRPSPQGVMGEICIAGPGLAIGYMDQPELSAQHFVEHPFRPGQRLYRSGDQGRWNLEGQLDYSGRIDGQVKIRGVRVELGDVAAALMRLPQIDNAIVGVIDPGELTAVEHCDRCGIPSNYPGVSFDDRQICGLCRAWERFGDQASQFFRSEQALNQLIEDIRQSPEAASAQHDALVLVSGGKDSTYMLHQLAGQGLRLLALTLDNGFLSEQAVENARRSAADLDIELLVVRTEHMNAIFADSLQRHSNVCHGCFKTIYTLALEEAKKRGIGAIFTGLSRGQIFETRLDDMFRARQFDVDAVEASILDARKVYHRVDDAVSRLLAPDLFADDTIFDAVRFIDFYRYVDVPLDQVYDFLEHRAPWVRPDDTGRSTNCLINDAGIFVHRRERGFHNYALPYSWDVRLGHKTRAAAMHELDDVIDTGRVRHILDEVDYAPGPPREEKQLVAYYVAAQEIPPARLREGLAEQLPEEFVPLHYVYLPEIPLAANGKPDMARLPAPPEHLETSTEYRPPDSDTELHIAEIWSSVLDESRVGVNDNFFDLGGRSLTAIQVAARIREDFEIELPMAAFFAAPTVAELAEAVEAELMAAVDAMSEAEVDALLEAHDP